MYTKTHWLYMYMYTKTHWPYMYTKTHWPRLTLKKLSHSIPESLGITLIIFQKRNLLSWKSDIQKIFCSPLDTNLNIILPYEFGLSEGRCASNHNFCDSAGSNPTGPLSCSELDFQASKFSLGSTPDFFTFSGFFFNSISKGILVTTTIC